MTPDNFSSLLPRPTHTQSLGEARGFHQPPPVSNTGVTSPSNTSVLVGIDWLSGTFNDSQAESMRRFLADFFSDEWALGKGALGFYQNSYRSSLGICMGLDPYQSEGSSRHDALISIPASVLSTVPQSRLHRLLGELILRFDFHYSRLDLKLDDYAKNITPYIAYDAWKLGNVSGFRVHRWISSGKLGAVSGCTLELGRRGKSGCGKFVRIYDKTVESGGAIDATRLEVEFSGDKCKQVVGFLASLPFEEFASNIVGIISGSLDFIDRSFSPGHPERCPRLAWWSAIVDRVDKIGLTTSRPVQTIQRIKSWVNKQVAPSLVTIMQTFDDMDSWWEYFWGAILPAEGRISQQNLAIIRQSKLVASLQ
jgi:Replication initiation factor